MLRSAAITTIKRGLGFRQTQDAAIISALQQVQRDLESGKTLPEWLVVYDGPLSVVAGTATVALPTGFLRLHEEYPLYYTNSEGGRVAIPRKNPEEATAAYGDLVDAGYPHVMSMQTDRILFTPTPTQNFTAYLTYYKAAVVLDSEVENAWLAHAANYLIGLAGVQVAGDLRDKGAMEKFALMAKMGNAAYIGAVVDAELAGRPLVMGRNN